MGKLQEQTIPTLFNGVSTQPHSVRFPGQVDDAENVTFSVETGGFAKRLGTRLMKRLGLPTDRKYKLHIINRDASEKYYVILFPGGIKVFDRSYNEKTVNLTAGASTFLNGDPENFSLLTSVDYTFIANRSITVRMDEVNVAPQPMSCAVIYVRLGFQGGAGDVFNITVNGTTAANYVAGSDQDASEVTTALMSRLVTNLGTANWAISKSGSYLFLTRKDGAAFTITQTSPSGDTGMKIAKDQIGAIADAPAKAVQNMMLQVKGATGDGYWVKFGADDNISGDGWWRETVAPGDPVKFIPETMPWGLIREADGTFTLKVLEWGEKVAGSDDSVPSPDFVNDTISDLVSARSRFGIVSGETTFFSATGDMFNFWPESSTEILDSDPFGVTSMTNSVSRFFYAVPFRRSVFIMADNAQFEISGDTFTPSTAAIDLATSYTASIRCRPVAVGDELYFPAEVGSVSTLLSYVYDERSVSETANDVTKHVRGFIPSPVIELEGDSVNSQVFALSERTQDKLYVHTFFYQGAERAQSSWGRYAFRDYEILSMGVLEGVLVLLVKWQNDIWLMELPTEEDDYGDFDWVPRTDNQVRRTGVYADGYTTWDLGYVPTDPVAITSNLFPEGQRMLSLKLEIVGTTVRAAGDWSASSVLIGDNFESFVILSKQFLRDANGTAIVNGRLQLRNMTLRYSDTGYFKVEVTPEARPTNQWIYSGRILGSDTNRIQKFAISSGKFRFGVNSNGETVAIRVSSDKFMPFVITSAAWVGFFNETSRQG